jgi:hypothetical protein
MKKLFLLSLIILFSRNIAFAGFLGGNSIPYINGSQESFALKLNSSIVMFGTPFSSTCLAGKYKYDELLQMYAKFGVGTIDYSTISGTKLTTDPLLSAFGLDYLLTGDRIGECVSLILEYETSSWSINKISNISNEIQLGMDYAFMTGSSRRTRFRISTHNFYAGIESSGRIASSTKYSLSTEIEYFFNSDLSSSVDGGIYFGDENGIIAYFGVGLGYNL